MNGKTHKVDSYLSTVSSHIADPLVRGEIELEMREHLLESIQDGISYGLSEDRAEAVAIEKMGEPLELGRRFAEIHRPKINWWIAGSAAVLLLVGLFAMNSVGRLGLQLVYGVVGAAVAAFLTFLDYSKLRRWAYVLLGLSFTVTAFGIVFGPQFDGQPYLFIGPLRIKIMDACPYLFVITLASITRGATWQSRPKSAFLLGLMMAGEILLFLGNGFPSLVLYLSAMLAVMLASKAKHWQLSVFGLTGACLILLMNDEHSFVTQAAFPAIRAAESHTDYVLSYLIDSFGKGIGTVIMASAMLLCLKLVEACREIKGELPRLVVTGICSLMATELAWSVLANLGWAPMPSVGLNFPFLSFGGTLMIVHFAAVGLVLSAYRRKSLRLIGA